jgi:putative solute:sodium symporter small subunit
MPAFLLVSRSHLIRAPRSPPRKIRTARPDRLAFIGQAFTVDPNCRFPAHAVNRRMTTPRALSNHSLSEPPPVTVAMARAHRAYWRFNLLLIGLLMLIGFSVSFGVPLLSMRLATVRFAGFPLPFYFGAQGAIVVYVVLTLVYIVLMQFADARLQRVLESSR